MGTSETNRPKELGFKIAAVMLALAIVFALAEAVAQIYDRIRYPRPDYTSQNSNILKNVSHPELGYVNQPGLDIVLNSSDPRGYFERYTMRITTDEHGSRVVPGKTWTEFGEQPVILVGDSVVFGNGVHDEETFAAQLMLKYDLPTINLGVSGYNTAQEWHHFEYVNAMEYDPRAVVLTYVTNDIEMIVRQWDRERKLLRIIEPADTISPLLRSSKLVTMTYNFLNYDPERYETGTLDNVGIEEVPKSRSDFFAGNISDSQWNMVTTHLMRFDGSLKAQDTDFLVLLMARSYQFEFEDQLRDYEAVQDQLATFLTEQKIDYVDLRPVIKEHGWEKMMLDSAHLSPFGHEIVAGIIADYVQEAAFSTGD